MQNSTGEILKKAIKTLELNTHTTDTGREFIFAGGNQFRTMWTRDFCYAVNGLLGIGKQNLVKSQLVLIYNFLSPKGILPRGIDRVSPKIRVVCNTLIPLSIRPRFGYSVNDKIFNQQIKGEYLGEHGTIAIDSNVLFILAYFSYANVTGDYFLKIDQIQELFFVYKDRQNGNLVFQEGFSDWQDSAKRNGVWTLLQIQILSALILFRKWTGMDVSGFAINSLERTILKEFFSESDYLFYQSLNSKTLALDYYGFIFMYKLFSSTLDHSQLYSNLKKHSIWTKFPIPGVPVSEYYPISQISWTNRLVGLAGYHDHFHWGWLIAESVKMAKLQNDSLEYQRIIKSYSHIVKNDQTLSEIYKYDGDVFKEFKGISYKSENPFSWTAAKWCEALTLS